MNFITLSGHSIDPQNPQFDSIQILDIAKALDKLCRFSGQVPAHYSVAAHSLAVSSLIESRGGNPEEALAGLLHDATEAYMADLPTPYKLACPDYIRLEQNLQRIIAERFDVNFDTFRVWQADKDVLEVEKHFQSQNDKSTKLHYIGRSCEKEFLRRFTELGGYKRMRKAAQKHQDKLDQELNDKLEYYDNLYEISTQYETTKAEKRKKNVRRKKK